MSLSLFLCIFNKFSLCLCIFNNTIPPVCDVYKEMFKYCMNIFSPSLVPSPPLRKSVLLVPPLFDCIILEQQSKTKGFLHIPYNDKLDLNFVGLITNSNVNDHDPYCCPIYVTINIKWQFVSIQTKI